MLKWKNRVYNIRTCVNCPTYIAVGPHLHCRGHCGTPSLPSLSQEWDCQYPCRVCQSLSSCEPEHGRWRWCGEFCYWKDSSDQIVHCPPFPRTSWAPCSSGNYICSEKREGWGLNKNVARSRTQNLYRICQSTTIICVHIYFVIVIITLI